MQIGTWTHSGEFVHTALEWRIYSRADLQNTPAMVGARMVTLHWTQR